MRHKVYFKQEERVETQEYSIVKIRPWMLSGKGDTDAMIENIHIKISYLPNKCRRFALKIMIQHFEILHEKAIFLSVVLILAADLRELSF